MMHLWNATFGTWVFSRNILYHGTVEVGQISVATKTSSRFELRAFLLMASGVTQVEMAQLTSSFECKYMRSESNPADAVSRGLPAVSIWFS